MAGRMSRAEAAQYKAYLQEQRTASAALKNGANLPPGTQKPTAHQSLSYMKHLMSESDSEVDEPGSSSGSSGRQLPPRHDSHIQPIALQHQVSSSPKSGGRHLSSHATTVNSAISPTGNPTQSSQLIQFPNGGTSPQAAMLVNATPSPPPSPRPHKPQRLSSSRNPTTNHSHALQPHSHTPNPHSPDNSSIDEKGRYHGLTLVQPDIDSILHSNGWLNDNVIAFYYQFLKYELFGRHKEVLFVKPAITYMLTLMSDPTEFENIAKPLRLHRRQLVFLPLSNESHWALLVYVRSLGVWLYYDSIRGAMQKQAMQLAARLFRFTSSASPSIANITEDEWSPSFKQMKTIQQQDGSSCGLFCLAISHIIADRYFKRNTLDVAMNITLHAPLPAAMIKDSDKDSSGDKASPRKSRERHTFWNKMTSVFDKDKDKSNHSDEKASQSHLDIVKSKPSRSPSPAPDLLQLEISPVECHTTPEAEKKEAEETKPIPAEDRCGDLSIPDTDVYHSLSQKFIDSFRDYLARLAIDRSFLTDRPRTPVLNAVERSASREPSPARAHTL